MIPRIQNLNLTITILLFFIFYRIFVTIYKEICTIENFKIKTILNPTIFI